MKEGENHGETPFESAPGIHAAPGRVSPFLAEPRAARASAPPVVVVTDEKPGAPARHGIDAVVRALADKGATVRRAWRVAAPSSQQVIVVGLSQGQGAAAQLLRALKIDPPTAAESLLVRHVEQNSRPLLLIAAPDDRGLMYALLDVADRIGWARDAAQPLGEVQDIREAPAAIPSTSGGLPRARTSTTARATR